MKVLTCLSLLLVVTNAYLQPHKVEFQDFKFRKTYRNQPEEAKRYTIFKENLCSIEEHNALYEQGLGSYKQGINQFTDMTQQEFSAMLVLSSSNKPHINAIQHVNTGNAIPDSVDWRTKGQVTEVNDQGFCGSCWAFSITGSTEGAHFRSSGKLVSLSEQQLIDCTRDTNFGCFGGHLEQTFPYIEQNGLQSEDTYSYMGVEGGCRYSPDDVVAKVSNYKVIDPRNENDLLDAVANIGPVSVALDASGLSKYKSGIYSDSNCTEQLNHGVLVVGYGSENGKDFWIVKNSWTTTFGEDGYFRILRGKNECGIAMDTVYPTCS